MDVDTVSTIAVIAIGVLILLAVTFAFLMKKIVGKVIAVLVLCALAVAVYLQRDALSDCARDCSCSFFGMDVEISDPDLAAQCRDLVSLPPVDRVPLNR